MVVKKQVKKTNVKLEKKPKIQLKNPKIEEKMSDSDDASFDDMSEEELKKMLGNSDNSDMESEDFSEEEKIESKEAKVNKKRKLESDDEDEPVLKSKLLKTEDEDDEVEDDEDDEDDEDEDSFEESFINDEEDEEIQDNENVKPSPVKSEKIKTIVKEKNPKIVKSEKSVVLDKARQEERDKQFIEHNKKREEFKKLFTDSTSVESESLKKEIKDRIINRAKRSFILLNLPYKFNFSMAKELVPDLVSIIVPYNLQRHQINGNAYIDVNDEETASMYIKNLHGLKLKNRQLAAFPLTKVDDNIDNYNCTRLALSNLPFNVNVEVIKRVLTKAITIELMPLGKVDKKMTRIAFAEYSCVEDAIYDMDTKHGLDINGLPVNIKFQCKSNTNIKKSISWDKTNLEVLGINKSVSEADIKKLFPQAKTINWKVGDQTATVAYESVAECEVDKTNAIQNMPSKNMKVFYKCLKHAKGPVASKPESTQDSEKISKGKNEKENAKKDVPVKKSEQKKFDKKGAKPKFDNKWKKPNFNKSKESGNKNGVKKTHLKPSPNKKFKNLSANKENEMASNRKPFVGHKTVKKEAFKTIKIESSISHGKDQQRKNPITKPSEQIVKKSVDQNPRVVQKKVDPNKEIKTEQRKTNKKDKNIKDNLINKKKQEKKERRRMKKKLQKNKKKIEKAA